MPFFKKKLLGIDLQPGELKLVQISKVANKLSLTRIAYRALPGFCMDSRRVSWDALTACLIEIVHELDIEGMDTSISLPVQMTHSHRLSLAKDLHEDDILQAIQAHLARTLQGTNSLAIDFATVPAADRSLQDVHFIAAKETTILQCIQAVGAAGLCVAVIDVDICALVRVVINSLSLDLMHGRSVIFYFTSNKAHLVIFNCICILQHYHWSNNLNFETVLAEANDRMQHDVESTNSLAHSIFCGDSQALTRMMKMSFSWGSQHHYFDLSVHLKSRLAPGSEFHHESALFLISCGAALHEHLQ